LELLKAEMQKNQELQNTIFRYIGVIPKEPTTESPVFVDTNTARRSWASIKKRLEEMTRQPKDVLEHEEGASAQQHGEI
jgi:hypothetical protein